MKDVVIVSAVRTPLGSFGGSLKNVSAVDLGSLVIKSALEKANIKPEQVDEVIMGNVLGAGLGQNVARQMSIHAGLPEFTPAFTINKVCGSGLKAVQLAAQAIQCGDADIIVCWWCRKHESSSICFAKLSLGWPYGRFESGRYHD